jgi:hypothetical protein
MPADTRRIDLVLECLKIMESTLLGLKQLRELTPKGLNRAMFDSLINEAESQIAEVKRKVMQ